MVVLPFNRRTPVTLYAFDGSYIERLLSGNPDTAAHFEAYFGQRIRSKVRARGLGGQFDDIRQETFVRVMRMLRSTSGLRDPGALGAFVHAVCTNVIRELARLPRNDSIDDDDPGALADEDTPTTESQLITDERQATIRRTLERLPTRDRDLLKAVFLDEQDKDRVCRQLGVSRDYLRVLIHRAKNEFRAQYRDDDVVTVTEAPAPAAARLTR